MILRELYPGMPVLFNKMPATFLEFDRKNGWFIFDVEGIKRKIFPCEIRAGWCEVKPVPKKK